MKENKLIGRKEEAALLNQCLLSGTAELIAVYGRRRVGKTYLIRHIYERAICFEITGIYQAPQKVQLANFAQALASVNKSGVPFSVPASWLDAFQQLKFHIEQLKQPGKKVLFFDELPWLDTKRSGFLQAFEHFWNSWVSRQNDLIVVICGSAASWMIKQIVNSKGGLHNRITKKIRLLPFSLTEMQQYLLSRRVQLDQYQLLQLYMVMGGIPHYLREVQPGESATQCIDRICFSKDGLLATEFKNLYAALYDQSDKHIQIVKTLSVKRSGLTRNEIIADTGISSGGTITTVLDELAESGFISTYTPMDKKTKDTLYRLTDEYSLFYLKFIQGNRTSGTGTWVLKSNSASWKSWSGYAFENICMKHLPQIKKALGIAGIYTEEAPWRFQDKNNGAQIDLLIDRRDRCINICEMKFSENVFEISKSYAAEMDNKIKTFRTLTKTNKTVFFTMITTFGVKENIYRTSMVTNTIEMDKLFE